MGGLFLGLRYALAQFFEARGEKMISSYLHYGAYFSPNTLMAGGTMKFTESESGKTRVEVSEIRSPVCVCVCV
jgi:hypothetical protein